MLVDKLFEDYEYYRLFTANYRRLQQKGRVLRKAKKTKARLNQLNRLIDFCKENKVDSRRYLYLLFQVRCWSFAPRWDHLVPSNEKTKDRALARYHAGVVGPEYAERIQHNSQNVKPGNIFDPNRDINLTLEAMKSRYLADMDTGLCMYLMAVTLGYHPKSKVCVQCPTAKECESHLQSLVPFDITALRLGKLSVDQAKREAWRYYGTC